MTSETDLPALVRFKGLLERGIVESYQGLRHLIKTEGFPPGFLLGPSSRAWRIDEVNAWLASRPSEPSRQTKERATRSIDARKTARQMLDEQEARS
jgi:hypothetical protein